MDKRTITMFHIQSKRKKVQCLFSGEDIPKETKCAALMTNKAYGNCTYKLINNKSLAYWLYLLGGKKYLRPSIVKKFMDYDVAEEI